MKATALSVRYLLAAKSCCGCGCKNCPYVSDFGEPHVRGSVRVNQELIRKIMSDRLEKRR